MAEERVIGASASDRNNSDSSFSMQYGVGSVSGKKRDDQLQSEGNISKQSTFKRERQKSILNNTSKYEIVGIKDSK